jgi:ABC-type transport system involved in cytochrome c biogenesis permease subunit
MNLFEAAVGSVLLAAVVTLALECIWKKSYIAIAASLYATIGLLMCLLFPEAIGSGIAPTHGILSSPIMAAHVAVIITGHALAGMTMVISFAYLLLVAIRLLRGDTLDSSAADLAGESRDVSTLVTVDRCNLVVVQLAAWTIAVGTILGAYWADFAWGRWWGWDPKETWALITALIYIAILHVRFVTPRQYRGLVTAVLCILGCAAMLFNWIVVNFLIAGKHSYA